MSIVIRGGSTGNLQEVSSTGEAKVVLSSSSSLPVPTGAALDGTDATGVSPPSGATGIRGWLSGIYNKLVGTLTVSGSVAVSSLPAIPAGSNAIGSVSVSNFPATQPVSGTFYPGTQPVSGTFFQATQPVSMAAVPTGGSTSALQTTGNSSLSTIATNVATSANQSLELAALNTIVSNTGTAATDSIVLGTITALNGTVSVGGQGIYTVTASVTGTWVGTIVFEGQLADNSWVGLPAAVLASVVPWQSMATASSNNTFVITGGGFQNIRIRASAFTSGTINIGLEGSLSQMTVIPVVPQSNRVNYFNSNGTTVIKTGAGRLHMVNTGIANNSGLAVLYDNTAGSGQVIAQIMGATGNASASSGPIDVGFFNGLTIVVSSAWQGAVYWS